jgi:hypothetical protein
MVCNPNRTPPKWKRIKTKFGNLIKLGVKKAKASVELHKTFFISKILGVFSKSDLQRILPSQ